jgi:hypothetical protein
MLFVRRAGFAGGLAASGVALCTSQSGRPTVSAQKYARSLVSEAIKLTCWLHAQQLELRDLRQDLLDAWIADGPGIRRRARLFTAWLQRADVTGALHVDWPYDFPQRPPLHGIHQARAAQWVRAAGATYSGYVELRIARDFGDVP